MTAKRKVSIKIVAKLRERLKQLRSQEPMGGWTKTELRDKAGMNVYRIDALQAVGILVQTQNHRPYIYQFNKQIDINDELVLRALQLCKDEEQAPPASPSQCLPLPLPTLTHHKINVGASVYDAEIVRIETDEATREKLKDIYDAPLDGIGSVKKEGDMYVVGWLQGKDRNAITQHELSRVLRPAKVRHEEYQPRAVAVSVCRIRYVTRQCLTSFYNEQMRLMSDDSAFVIIEQMRHVRPNGKKDIVKIKKALQSLAEGLPMDKIDWSNVSLYKEHDHLTTIPD